MATNYLSQLVGVFGHPVAENPTIVMQEAAFAALGLNWRYLNIDVLPADLERAMQGLRAMNFAGINCTIPHKVAVLEHLDEVASDAALIGAVNTVRRVQNKLIGENTDGKGFLRSLRDANFEAHNARVLILGAGGAARAIGVELALHGAAQITIVNRDETRGRALAELLRHGTPVAANFVNWTPDYRVPADTDLLVNATSIGLYPDVTDKPGLDYASILPSMLVCDVIPNPPRTAFLREAEARGARTLDGLGMLVYQGAIAFTLWTGHEAPLEVMRAALERAFGAAS